MCVAGNEMSSSAPEVLGAGSNGLSVWVSSRREAAMASSTTPVSFLAPPLEQLRHLAEELRSLLPRVRGELWESAPQALGREVGRQVRAPLTRLLLSGWSGLPQVGEAQETAEEFNREIFWRRLSECLCRCGLFLHLPASYPLFLLLSPEMTIPPSPQPFCYPFSALEAEI